MSFSPPPRFPERARQVGCFRPAGRRAALAAAAAVLAVSVTARAETPAAQDDFAQGVELRQGGHPALAAAALERAAQAHPGDADIWFNLALCYMALGRLDPAGQALDRALQIAPDYADVKVARARLALIRGDLEAAQAQVEGVLAKAPKNDEAVELARQIDAARAGAALWRFDAAYSEGFLSKGLPQTQDAVLGLARNLPGGRSVAVSVERVRQFGLSDTYAEVTAANRVGYIAAGGAPNSYFRPRWAVRVGWESPGRRIGGWNWRPTLDVAWSRYPTGNVQALNAGFEVEPASDWLLGAKWIAVHDELRQWLTGYATHAQWRAAPTLELSAGWADAPENDVGRTMRVRTATVGAGWDVSPRTTLHLSADHEMRQAYTHDDLNVAVTQRF